MELRMLTNRYKQAIREYVRASEGGNQRRRDQAHVRQHWNLAYVRLQVAEEGYLSALKAAPLRSPEWKEARWVLTPDEINIAKGAFRWISWEGPQPKGSRL